MNSVWNTNMGHRFFQHIEVIAHELKRGNDLKEQELQILWEELELKKTSQKQTNTPNRDTAWER